MVKKNRYFSYIEKRNKTMVRDSSYLNETLFNFIFFNIINNFFIKTQKFFRVENCFPTPLVFFPFKSSTFSFSSFRRGVL